MATDGPDPAPCQRDIYEKGICVAVFGDVGGSNRFERLVQAASQRYSVRMDWHFAGGRALLKCMPHDEAKAAKAVAQYIRPVLNGAAPPGMMMVKSERPG